MDDEAGEYEKRKDIQQCESDRRCSGVEAFDGVLLSIQFNTAKEVCVVEHVVCGIYLDC